HLLPAQPSTRRGRIHAQRGFNGCREPVVPASQAVATPEYAGIKTPIERPHDIHRMKSPIWQMEEIPENFAATPVRGQITSGGRRQAGLPVRTRIVDAVVRQSVEEQGVLHKALEIG